MSKTAKVGEEMRLILKANTLSQCMDAMAEYAAAYEKQGGKNLIFCEDRLTLLAEKALLRATGGTFQSSVSTFARFLKTDARVISKQGSVMAVGEVMTRLQREGKLQCFTTSFGVGNYAKCIYETLAQLSASEVTPDVLRESLAQLPDDTLKKKVSDLAEIYESYTEFLRERAFVDESKYLSLLPDYLRKRADLKDTNVFFLCFNSFTAQAVKVIRAALEGAKNVVGVFCAGNEEIYANRAVSTFIDVCDGDYKSLELGKPLQGAAESLRRGLFNPEWKAPQRTPTTQICLFEAGSKNAEVEYVARKIRRAMAENKELRYRDFAVLASDMAAYALPLKKALQEDYGIPYFMDEKKSLKRHPLSRFLLDCFRVVRERFSTASVQSLTQNYFFGESDAYRNYLLKFANYRGGAKRAIKRDERVEATYEIDKLEEGRNRVLLATENIKAGGHGRVYCAAVRKIIENFSVKEKLEILEKEIDDVAQKGYLAQIYRTLERVLDEAEMLTGAQEMTVAEFEAVLQDGLEAAEISLIPLKADAVFIGDVTDSRIEHAHTLFVVGMTDAVPRNGSDTAIISDKEIARLADVKAMIEPTVAEVNLRNRESACLNLCAFSHTLHLSYSLSTDGSEPSLSDVFRYVNQIFCADEEGNPLPRVKKMSADDFPYQCSAATPAIRQLLISKSEYARRKVDENNQYSSLYAALDKLSVQGRDDYLEERGGHVCVQRGKELFFSDGTIPPTVLEKYFECPFRHFAEEGLKLKEREETAVLAVDTGNFIHKLLEKTVPLSNKMDTEEDMRRYALEVGTKLLQSSVYTAGQDTETGVYFSEKLLSEGAEVAVAAYRQLKNSEFVVSATEYRVQTEEIKGKVDRIDTTEEYVRVIDYKTGTIDDSAAAYYTARKMQLQLYMSEVKGDKVPAGVFYFPASVDYGNEEGKFRMKGFLNGEEKVLLAGDIHLTADKKSEYFPASLRNSALTKRVMDEQTFRDFLDYAVHVARKGCEELREGYIAPSPYKDGCVYCKYGGMCGFQKDVGSERVETDIDPKTIAAIAREARGE